MVVPPELALNCVLRPVNVTLTSSFELLVPVIISTGGTSIELVVADVRPLAESCNVYPVLGMLSVSPLKLATPATAFTLMFRPACCNGIRSQRRGDAYR